VRVSVRDTAVLLRARSQPKAAVAPRRAVIDAKKLDQRVKRRVVKLLHNGAIRSQRQRHEQTENHFVREPVFFVCLFVRSVCLRRSQAPKASSLAANKRRLHVGRRLLAAHHLSVDVEAARMRRTRERGAADAIGRHARAGPAARNETTGERCVDERGRLTSTSQERQTASRDTRRPATRCDRSRSSAPPPRSTVVAAAAALGQSRQQQRARARTRPTRRTTVDCCVETNSK
jgi:hypothetical protein